MSKMNVRLLAVVAVLFSSMLAQAYLVPGGRGPSIPSGPSLEPVNPGHPGWGPSNPGRPDRPGRPGNERPGRSVIKSIALYRTVANESLPLKQLAGIGRAEEGMIVESVTVNLRNARGNAELQLLVNGMVDEVRRANSSVVVLQPRQESMIGRDVNTLRLQVRGLTEINTIEIRLREGRGGPGGPVQPPRPPMNETIVLNINQATSSNGRIDLSSMMDVRRLQGMRIQSMTLRGYAQGGSALVDVTMDGRMIARTMDLTRSSIEQVVQLDRVAEISQYGRLELMTRGMAVIERVTIQLVRGGR